MSLCLILEHSPSKLVIFHGVFILDDASQDHVIQGRNGEGKGFSPHRAELVVLGTGLLVAIVLVNGLRLVYG